MKVLFNEWEIDIKARFISEPGFTKSSTLIFLHQLMADYKDLIEYEKKDGMNALAAYDRRMVDAINDVCLQEARDEA